MVLDTKDKDRILAACQAAVMRVARERGLPLVFPATVVLTHDTDAALGIELQFAKEKEGGRVAQA